MTPQAAVLTEQERMEKIKTSAAALPMPMGETWASNTAVATQVLLELAPLTWSEFLEFHRAFKLKAGHKALGKLYTDIANKTLGRS